MKAPQVDTSNNNLTNVRLTRQKAALFQWFAVPLWFPTEKSIPFECFSTRRPASSLAFGGLIHKEANPVLDRCSASRCRPVQPRGPPIYPRLVPQTSSSSSGMKRTGSPTS